MLCRKPFVARGLAFGCGQCLPCRINRRRVWAHRIVLESLMHSENTFVTLTYRESVLPLVWLTETEIVSTLAACHLRNFLKRLRRKVEPLRFRFFAVGEYGEVSFRPHYHLMLFGFPGCRHQMTRRDQLTKEPLEDCCDRCSLLFKTWKYGNVFQGAVNKETAEYVAKYTIKKMVSKDDPRLGGRNPEFSRMSNRRGIGFDALWDIGDALMKYGLIGESVVDVPSAMKHGGSERPLGRYLRQNLREIVGREKDTPQGVMDEVQAEMLPVWLRSIENEESFAKSLSEVSLGDYNALVARYKLFGGKGQI